LYEETLRSVLAETRPAGTERIPLEEAAGRVLAEPILADRSLPPFARSERDGWAVRSADLPAGEGTLRREEGVLHAGDVSAKPLGRGRCMRIMTGAPLPQGADAVVMIEHARERGEFVDLHDKEVAPSRHVHGEGTDARRGDVLVLPGLPLTPPRAAVAASVGASLILVYKSIRVAIITTGDELVPDGAVPGPARIRDGNGPAARAIFHALPWIEIAGARTVGDDEDRLAETVRASLECSDAVLLSGGVSMGDRDFVPRTLERCGVRRILHKTAIRPGKPFWFGVSPGGILVFGLPGNPVSFQVTLREIALAGLRRKAGFSKPRPIDLRLPLRSGFEKAIELRQFLPAILEEEDGRTVAEALAHNGSGDFAGISRAEGVVVLPEGRRRFEKGEMVVFHSWSLR
jgi:molybdopterin molybdotransferase